MVADQKVPSRPIVAVATDDADLNNRDDSLEEIIQEQRKQLIGSDKPGKMRDGDLAKKS